MSSWALTAPDGRRFLWNKAPTYLCPLADPVEYPGREGGEHVLRPATAPALEAAAAAIGGDALLLGRAIRLAHQRAHGTQRLRVNDRPTDLCAVCGARLERLGFRIWIDTPRDPTTVERQLAEHLGLDAPREVLFNSYADTKREAEAWARDELAGAKAAAADPTPPARRRRRQTPGATA